MQNKKVIKSIISQYTRLALVAVMTIKIFTKNVNVNLNGNRTIQNFRIKCIKFNGSCKIS